MFNGYIDSAISEVKILSDPHFLNSWPYFKVKISYLLGKGNPYFPLLLKYSSYSIDILTYRANCQFRGNGTWFKIQLVAVFLRSRKRQVFQSDHESDTVVHTFIPVSDLTTRTWRDIELCSYFWHWSVKLNLPQSVSTQSKLTHNAGLINKCFFKGHFLICLQIITLSNCE